MKLTKKLISFSMIALTLLLGFAPALSTAENANDGIMLLEDLKPDTNMRDECLKF